MSDHGVLASALYYASRGWRVFPLHNVLEAVHPGTNRHICDCKDGATCESEGKHPYLSNGVKGATTDIAQIKKWFDHDYPSANVGIATGPESAIVVIDIDTRTGGVESLADLEKEHGCLPITIEAITGSQGRHIFFEYPDSEVKNSAGKLGKGIDVRGVGGYVVGSPSMHHGGKRYQWDEAKLPSQTNLASLPAWIIITLQKDKISHTKFKDKDGDGQDKFYIDENRNNTLTSLAGYMRLGGMTPESILIALRSENDLRCRPPLPDSEVVVIANSIGKRPVGDTHPEQPTLDSAHVVIDRLKSYPTAIDAIRDALTTETLGSLAILADQDGGLLEAVLFALGEKGAKTKDLATLRRAINAEIRKLRHIRLVANDDHGLPKVHDVLPDAPVPPTTVIPSGWRLAVDLIAKESSASNNSGGGTSQSLIIASSPVVIAGRLKDVSDHSESLRLAYLRDGQWLQHTVGREKVHSSRTLVELSGIGMPVDSETVGDMVKYLSAFEAANITVLPKAHVSNQMGWQGEEGDKGFLWGRTLIRPDGQKIASVQLDKIAPVDWKEDWISFLGDDSGDEQLVDGYHQLGTFEAWRTAIAPIAAYPRVVLSLYVALATPLLMILRARNFAVDWSYITSTGKTTTLRLAASCWGCPDERAPAAAIGTWDATRVWIERASAILNGIPLILDDTKRARSEKTVGQTIYDVISGRGRGRGSVGGTRKVSSWQTVMMSNGEQKITSFTQDGGTRARVLEVWGIPFGGTTKDIGRVVRDMDLGIRQNYGHAGVRMIQYCLQHRADWPEWREEYARVQAEYHERAGDNAVAGRIAEPMAIIDMAAAFAHAALDLPWDYIDPMKDLYDGLLKEASSADRAMVALHYVKNWADDHTNAFFGRHETTPSGQTRVPSEGWAGRWEIQDDWEWIAFSPRRLQEILRTMDFEPDSIIQVWADRGWIIQQRGLQFQTRINGNRVWTIAIRRDVLSTEDFDDEVKSTD